MANTTQWHTAARAAALPHRPREQKLEGFAREHGIDPEGFYVLVQHELRSGACNFNHRGPAPLQIVGTPLRAAPKTGAAAVGEGGGGGGGGGSGGGGGGGGGGVNRSARLLQVIHQATDFAVWAEGMRDAVRSQRELESVD